VNKLGLLITASLRSQLRWAGEHLYYWLVLGPVVVGFTTLTAARVVDNLSDWRPAPAGIIAASIAFELALVALSLSRATAEIYHLRRPEAYFDALPVASRTHLHAAMAARTGRTMVVATAALAAHWMAGAGLIKAANWLPLALFIFVTSLTETFAALNWIHWNHRRQKAVAALALPMLLAGAASGGMLLAQVIRDEPFSTSAGRWPALAAGLIGLALYFITVRQHSGATCN